MSWIAEKFLIKNKVIVVLKKKCHLIKKKRSLQFFDEFLLVESIGQVALVAEHEHRNAGQLRLVEQIVEFGLGGAEGLLVRRVDHVHDGVHAATVALPHGAETRLTANVPELDAYIAFTICNYIFKLYSFNSVI